jgi:ElaB/YqjD/DUF883 family membrane-anchored ribosome-binding protein
MVPRADEIDQLDPTDDMEDTVLITEAAHNAVSSAVDTAKEAVGGVVGSAKEKVSGVVETAKGAGSTVVETVRENPVPYALIGFGLGWLYMSARKSGGSRSFVERRSFPEFAPTADYAPSNGDTLERTDDEISTWDRPYGTPNLNMLRSEDQRAERSGVGETVRQARDKIGDVAESVQEKSAQVIDQVQAKAGQMVDQAQERMSDLRMRSADQARAMAQGFQRTVEENPLLIGALALGLGAAVGFIMPATQPEKRLMGETRDRLVENAQQTAHEVV